MRAQALAILLIGCAGARHIDRSGSAGPRSGAQRRGESIDYQAHRGGRALRPENTLDSFAHYMDLNEAFHLAIIDLAKSQMVKRAFEQAVSLPFASPSAMVFPTSGLANADEALAIAKMHHRSLIDAIQTRQGTRAEHLAREHAFLGRRVLSMALSDSETLSRIPGASLINPSIRARS